MKMFIRKLFTKDQSHDIQHTCNSRPTWIEAQLMKVRVAEDYEHT